MRPLVVLLLLAATLRSHAVEPSSKDIAKPSHHHHKKDVKRDYGFKAAEGHHQPKPEHQQGYGGPQQQQSYGSGNEARHECKDDCPNPQPADAVSNAYMKHYTFTWADLAQEYAESLDGGKQAPNSSKQKLRTRTQPKQPKVPGEASFNPSLTMLRQRASNLAKQTVPTKTPSNSPPTRKAPERRMLRPGSDQGYKAELTAIGPDGAVGAEAQNSTVAQIAAVTDPGFLLPINPDYTQRGFAGTTDTPVPTEEALAVGPHPADPDSVLVLHGVKRMFEIFSASREGQKIDSSVHTKVPTWLITQKMGYNTTATSPMNTASHTAFYDKSDNRYVIAFALYHYNFAADDDDPESHVIVCVSADRNPLAKWTCWSLDALPWAAPLVPFCAGNPKGHFIANSPEVTYSHDGLFISISSFCVKPLPEGGFEVLAFQPALYAFPKNVLYSAPPDVPPTGGGNKRRKTDDIKIWRATYLPTSSWYHSLPARDQLLEFDAQPQPGNLDANKFASFVRPALPQTADDVADPVFVIGKVSGNRYMSIARLTGEPLNDMDSRRTAPRIYAAVVRKPDDFRNVPPYTFNDDLPRAIIPQPGDASPLDAGDLHYDGRTYGATKFRGLVFVATSEFFGAEEDRLPAIFWAIVEPSAKLCSPSLTNWGLVASVNGLSLAYPVITGRHDCGAFLAFAYGGNTTIELNGEAYPAYAGAASAVVGCKGMREEITTVKRGEGLVTRSDAPVQRWGDYSAWSPLDDRIWFAVPYAADTDLQYGSWISTERC